MKKLLFVLVFVSLFFVYGFSADVPAKDVVLEELRAEIEANGYSFTVGHNPACAYTLDQLCSLNPELAYTNFNIGEQGREEISRAMAVPASYMGYCGGVRNQGNCGSCWAFGSVGAVEGAFGFQGGLNYDLSEQQMLDCNPYGYSCNGGWFCFDNALSPGLTTESNYRYVAYKKACTVTSPYYPISAAYYVKNSSSIPKTSDIKTAIMTYGNVGAAVYVNSAFQYYTSGVFNSCQKLSCNHAIVLCGWDDSLGAWRLKNSWGTGWGESGFMWITYACSNVGYAACYAIY